jgi:primosomal protein N' (replication factor Y)
VDRDEAYPRWSVSGVIQVEPLTTARSLRGPFDYTRPDGVGVGSVLDVRFGRQKLAAIVTAVTESSEHKLSDPLRVHAESLPTDLVDLGVWMAKEYCSTPARALSLMLPPKGATERKLLWADTARPPDAGERITAGQQALLASLPRFVGKDLPSLRRLEGRGLVTIEPRARRRAPQHTAVGATKTVELNDDQIAALQRIVTAAPGDKLLLAGVTGSGKTEVYLRAAQQTLAAGKSVIVLVPEIALTPQMVQRFVARFGDTVAVLHSKLSDGERHDEWLRLRRGEARIAVGPRSAVFAPLDEIGLIVVDEEHDSSYKHEGDPRYDARLVAERRARDAVLVCGSATPRPETVHLLPRIEMPSRVDGAAMPPVEIVDLSECAGYLHPRTQAALTASRKAIVLLNRRGWSNYLTCGSCARAWECPNCDVALVLHRADGAIACHHCGHREQIPRVCGDCGSVSIARHGAGTERAERDLAQIAPVLRLDAGVAEPGSVLARFNDADHAILVGTQVVAKGHDFPDVDLGVVLDADSTLRFPDFRAEERTFALVTQLAGRAGRARHGHVIVQTSAPDAPSIAHAATHDSEGFIAGELQRRRALRYPPFSSLIRVVCSGARDDGPEQALAAATDMRARLDEALGPAPLFRLRGRDRAQVVVKASDRERAIAQTDAAVRTVSADSSYKGVAFSVDVDPQ